MNGFTADQWTALQKEFQLLPGEGTAPCGPLEHGLDCNALVNFGHELFWEPAMSTRQGSNGLIPGTVSCVTCHDPTKWFIDSRTPNNVSMGATKPTARNAMTVVNMALKSDLEPTGQHWFSWIGTFDSAGAVTQLAVEKAMSTKTDVALAAVMAIPRYAAEYQQVFGQQQPSFKNLELALDAYMRSLVSLDAPFDRYIAGQEDAISDSAKRGFAVFVGRGTCISCHKGAAFNDYWAHDTGVPATGSTVDRGLGSADPDFEGAFATQGLRNIARTGPYMHNGSIPSLDAVVDFYRNGGGATDYDGVKDPRITPLDLSDDDAHDLVEFLRALNGADIPCPLQSDIRSGGVPKTDCNGVCVDTLTDRSNCGGCGKACTGSESCIMGGCVLAQNCPAGLTECAVGGCVNLQSDSNHCGDCAHMCGPMEACEMGTCLPQMMCPPGWGLCGNMCFDFMNDPLNCGSCGHMCPTYCMAGQCG